MSDIREDQVSATNGAAAVEEQSHKPEQVTAEINGVDKTEDANAVSSSETGVVSEECAAVGEVEVSANGETETNANENNHPVKEAEANGQEGTPSKANGHSIDTTTEPAENGHHVDESADKMDITTSPVDEKVEVGEKRARDEDDADNQGPEEQENGKETKKVKLDNGDATGQQQNVESNGIQEPAPKRKPGRPKKSESEAKAVVEEAIDDANISRRTRSKA